MSTDEKTRAIEIATAVLFERVREFITRFVRLSQHEATAIALWVMMTYALPSFDCVPYVSVTSAEKRSGKTRLLEVLELLVARPWLTGRATPAVLARKIHAEQSTLLLDESDATFRGDKEFAQALRGILNTGYLRSGRTSVCIVKGRSVDYLDFSTFGPKVIAGIGSLPDTVADRCIPIRLARKLPGEHVDRFRRRFADVEASGLRAELKQWVNADFVGADHPEPQGLSDLPDRAADIWEPLLMIAERCGAEVAAAARAASVVLSGREHEDESLNVQLLADAKRVFDWDGVDRIASADLARKLAAIEESPWGPRFGRDFDSREVAKMLKPFAIRPGTVRLSEGTAKGYHRHSFTDAWARYLPFPEKP